MKTSDMARTLLFFLACLFLAAVCVASELGWLNPVVFEAPPVKSTDPTSSTLAAIVSVSGAVVLVAAYQWSNVAVKRDGISVDSAYSALLSFVNSVLFSAIGIKAQDHLSFEAVPLQQQFHRVTEKDQPQKEERSEEQKDELPFYPSYASPQAAAAAAAAINVYIRAIRRAVLPTLVRGINVGGGFVEKWLPWFRPLRWMFPADADVMIRWASHATGLTDTGTGNFLESLRIAVGDMEGAKLTTAGYLIVWFDTQRLIQTRLQLIDMKKKHPEIENEKVEAPVFILGVPRSGTSLLYNLMALDSGSYRYPTLWETQYMVPEPHSSTYTTDPRIAQMHDFLDVFSTLVPSFQDIHPMTATSPQETFFLTCYDGTFIPSFSHMDAPNYLKTLTNGKHDTTYEFLRWQLKYLQWRGPKAPQWLLKCPFQILDMADLLKVFPDARIIMTHRDPKSVLPSARSYLRAFRSLFSDALDMTEIKSTVSIFVEGLNEVIRVRANPPAAKHGGASWQPEQAVDVQYRHLVADPVEEVRRIYQCLGKELSPEAEARMRLYMKIDKQERRKPHVYRWEDMQMDKDEEERLTSNYVQHFNVLPDPPRRPHA